MPGFTARPGCNPAAINKDLLPLVKIKRVLQGQSPRKRMVLTVRFTGALPKNKEPVIID